MARILRQVTVTRDGWHNAFTDLAFWQGMYCVSYRKGAGHISMDGECVMAISIDRTRFREVAHLRVPGDNRDPKLVPMGDDRMAMIFPSWIEGVPKERLQQFVSFTTNGFDWDAPRPILAENRWLWRVRRHEGKYYGMAYGWRPGTPRTDRIYYMEFLVSHDLLKWERLSQIGGDELKLGESDVHFQPDGEAWIVSRSARKPSLSVLCCAKPPYTQWTITELNVMIHAPVMLAHNGALYVAGRRSADQEGDATFPFLGRHSLGIWTVTRDGVTPVLRIPATGDCSYPGLIRDPDGRICLSYYSQHAYEMGVVPFDFRREPTPPHDVGKLLAVNDVYFAELELP